MSVQHILKFFRDPKGFAATLPPDAVSSWRRALSEIALPLSSKEGSWPLREAQVRAWEGIADRRVALVLGPPGTGKTFILSWMALAYIEARRRAGLPCRVLVTGFTRNAIANLLEGIAERAQEHGIDLPIIYAGNPPEGGVPSGCEEVNAKEEARTRLDAQHLVMGCSVWMLYLILNGATLPGSTGPTAEIFDLICIDEASQLVLTQGLMALAGMANGARVLVAGDNRQLPPVSGVHEHEIEGRPLGVSLYDFLVRQEVAEFALDETFRLNAPLTAFPEQRFYPGQYRSADKVAERRIVWREGWRSELNDFERLVLDPDFPLAVVVHDGPPGGTSNPFEARLVAKFARLVRDCRPEASDGTPFDGVEFWQDRLAVISPHRAQNALIRDIVAASGFGREVTVETVDRIQGRERDCVIACYSVSDPEFAVAEASFIFSRERLNVMATRARSKFILVVSRRLLEAIPTDEDDFDAAQVLREFVYSATEAGTFMLEDGDGKRVLTSLRLRGFPSGPAVPILGETKPIVSYQIEAPAFSAEHGATLEAIRLLAAKNQRYGTATTSDVSKYLYRAVPLDVFRDLFRQGWIDLRQQSGSYGTFWTARPFDEQRSVMPATREVVSARIEDALHGARRSRFAPLYHDVRARFDWIGDDFTDALEPIISEMVRAGQLVRGDANGRPTLDLAFAVDTDDEPLPPPPEALSDDDFRLLNELESREAERINFGVFESWVPANELQGEPEERDAALRRLLAHGFIMRTEDGRIRSRMAELAREVRYVKQRFAPGDADKRPYLVRALKVRTIDRNKPRLDTPYSAVEGQLNTTLGSDNARRAIRAVGEMLVRVWGTKEPILRAFQGRALAAVIGAWTGTTEADTFVITADTGSGKTEAACLPLISGAICDALAGIDGTRAILVYPRIRLGNNQAQRLARYLASLATLENVPRLTLGVQNTDVPNAFGRRMHKDYEEVWKRTATGWTFPFFECPQSECGRPLFLEPERGHNGADRLFCSQCGWTFDGWVGSKEALQRRPPSLFLPVTESLHQWLQDSRYGRLWGDVQAQQPPRALLADEIHLYTHVHGAQVGFALRRLLRRLEVNGGTGPRPLALGMSATLANASGMWSELTGRPGAVAIQVANEERDDNPRGREYYYIVQPEVESRGKDIAGASTTIQSLMTLAHGMRRRTGSEGGYRGLVFLDSIDKVRRLHSDYMDAEEGKRLAQLRTHLFGGNGGGQHGCCGSPHVCGTFRKGECWFFAATDPAQWTARGRYDCRKHLDVADSPVFSGNRKNVERMIRSSDVVFATSSLEVGYDDPDMMLVYQHYAPTNIASFVQRKGRGGRGADDRPLTGVTLSVYSPRDSWLFRRPDQLLDGSGFVAPLNMQNYFVRRGHALASALDALAQWRARSGEYVDPRQLTEDQRQVIERYVGDQFASLVTDSGSSSLGDLVRRWFTGTLKPDYAQPEPRAWMAVVPWAPKNLFASINVPLVNVTPEQQREVAEDIALAFSECAPGNVTRRYDRFAAHWTPAVDGRFPMVSSDTEVERIAVRGAAPAELLPDEVHSQLRAIAPDILRPRSLNLSIAGRFHGADWTPEWAYDARTRRVVRKPKEANSTLPTVQPKTRGSLSGVTAVIADPARGTPIEAAALKPLFRTVLTFEGRTIGPQGTGLEAYHVYWGADVDLRLSDKNDLNLTQTFVTHHDPQVVQLYGYRMETEGVQFELDSDTLSHFISAELERLRGTPEERALNARMFRYLVESRAGRMGVGVFDGRRLAELLTSAATGTLRDRFQALRKMWDGPSFGALLRDAYKECLEFHPLLSVRRIDTLIDEVTANPGTRGLVLGALQDVSTAEKRSSYVRTLLLHSIAVRLKQLFVLYGCGDERRVRFNVRLPMQFASHARDVISVFEHGEYGDGTTRLFRQRAGDALNALRSGFLVECENERQDAAARAVLARPERHEAWSRLDPRRPDTLQILKEELSAAEEGSLQTALRLLYGVESIEGNRFSVLDLHREVDAVRVQLDQAMGRPALAWELVSKTVTLARKGDALVPVLSALHEAYRNIQDAASEERLSADARLAEQVFRSGVALCQDGCPACVHCGSDLMSSSLAEASVSRSTLARLVAALGWT